MAAGQADVVVGLSTFNDVPSVVPVVDAILDAFATTLHRERTVLIAADAGSTDGTVDAVRGSTGEPSSIITSRHPLRTVHRILATYVDTPNQPTGLRLLLASA